MATHSSILTWRIPWTGETGRPQSIGSQRVRQDSTHIIFSVFIYKYFLISLVIFSLMHLLFKSMLSKFYKFVHFPILVLFNFLTSSLDEKKILHYKKILCMISILLNLLRLNLWPNIYSVLENVHCLVEKNVRSVVVTVFYIRLLDLIGLLCYEFSISLLLSDCSIHYWE